MKKFAVLKKIGMFNAEVVRDFDSRSDAFKFSALMQKSEDNARIEYFVVAVLAPRDENGNLIKSDADVLEFT